jgi:polysaccharide biosynthesis/export protein
MTKLLSFRQLFFYCVLAVATSAAAQPAGDTAEHAKAVADTKPAVTGTNQLNPQSPDYIIGDGDLLAINVWHEQEISRVLPVRPDGKLTLPLLGDIEAKGCTPKQLQDNIAKGLRKYLENPEVAVMVQEPRSRHFSIVGQVTRPGSFSLNQPLTVLDALALSGGFRDFAKESKIYLLRSAPNGTRQRIPFNYKKVVRGESPNQNVLLQPGDTIVVP